MRMIYTKEKTNINKPNSALNVLSKCCYYYCNHNTRLHRCYCYHHLLLLIKTFIYDFFHHYRYFVTMRTWTMRKTFVTIRKKRTHLRSIIHLPDRWRIDNWKLALSLSLSRECVRRVNTWACELSSFLQRREKKKKKSTKRPVSAKYHLIP